MCEQEHVLFQLNVEKILEIKRKKYILFSITYIFEKIYAPITEMHYKVKLVHFCTWMIKSSYSSRYTLQ
jgi:hypothetical protein